MAEAAQAEQTRPVQAADDHRAATAGLGDLEWLGCVFPDGVTVEAEARPDLPWHWMFQGLHPVHGLRYFRARRRGAARDQIGPSQLEVWDVTEAYARLAAWRLKRARTARAAGVKTQRQRIKASAYQPKPGAPTPERRRRGGIAREIIADPETGDTLLIYRAPDRLVAMHKRGTLTRAQLDAANRFHAAFIAAGLDPERAANMARIPGCPGAGPPPAVLDAKAEVWAIYDHLGGRGCLSVRVLRAIVGEDRAIDDCVRVERGGNNAVNKHQVAGVLATALDGVSGYYATRSRYEQWRRAALRGAITGALSQGA